MTSLKVDRATAKGNSDAMSLCLKHLNKTTQLAEQNRKLFPQVTAWVDSLRAEFGEVRVRYANERGGKRGIRGDYPAEWGIA